MRPVPVYRNGDVIRIDVVRAPAIRCPPAQPEASVMATRVRKVIGYKGGSEGAVSGLGTFLMWSGVLGFVIAGVIFLASGFQAAFLILAVVSLFQGVAAGFLSDALADVIRLLKRQNGLSFGGGISEVKPVYGEVCSECGNDITGYGDVTYRKCGKCGAIFETKQGMP
jgi:hypothetical protein